MTTTNIIWVYTALIVVGGFIGFLKAKSTMSLITSAICAVPLVLVALGKAPLLVAQLVAGGLMVFFALRFSSSKKVMPAGMMAGLSLVTLGLLLWVSHG